MCRSYVRQIPMVRLGLTVDGAVAWFWREHVANVRGWDGDCAAEQYTLSYMLEVIRTAAGPGWLPRRLRLETVSGCWSASTSKLPDVEIEHGSSMIAIAIPLPLLSLPVTIPSPTARVGGDEPPASDFQGSLRQVLRPWLAGALPSQELAAELIWSTPRTLRRRLAEEGTTWRAFLQELTFARAVERLQDERCSIRELAEELGYSRPEHFTRFFRNRTGVPPSAYCATVERARELAARQRPV